MNKKLLLEQWEEGNIARSISLIIPNFATFCQVSFHLKEMVTWTLRNSKCGAKWVIVEMLTKLCEILESKYFISCKDKADVKRVATMRYKSLFAFYLRLFRTFTEHMKTYQYPISTILSDDNFFFIYRNNLESNAFNVLLFIP